MLKVLIACECSQTVCKEFRLLGDECYSCDLDDEYGGHPEWHIKSDCLPLLKGNCQFVTMDGVSHYVGKWDLIIAHPPCTYLSRTQNQLYDRNRLGDEYVTERERERERAIKFFLAFTKLETPTLIENPIGYMNTHYKKPTQIIQPFEYGDSASKPTCLWLFRLPKLQPTKIVDPPPSHKFPSSNTMGGWYYETMKLPRKDRAKVRSKTFPGIARAIAYQYHRYLTYFC